MRNLAGVTTGHANAYIEDELNEAGIPAHPYDHVGEVNATLCGKWGDFLLVRAWSYWVVLGPVVLDIAWQLYHDPRGRYDVRVAGHCGCVEPIPPWINTRKTPYTVDEYHIDSQDGLNLFAELALGTRALPLTEEAKEEAKEIARQNRTGGRVIYEDEPTENDYLHAASEIKEIRSDLSTNRRRLEEIARNFDRSAGSQSLALDGARALSVLIHTLYDLEDKEQARSFPARADATRKLWDNLHRHPTRYVLRESHNE